MINIAPFFDKTTFTFSYVVSDAKTKDCVIIDAVLDFHDTTATISYQSAQKILTHIEQNQLQPKLVIDTHCHADHMTAAFYLKTLLGIKSVIGRGFEQVQKYFAGVYNLSHALEKYEPSYDKMLEHGQKIEAGSLNLTALAVPGHTPSCTAYLIEDTVFVGDALFVPELGCGRCDFPGGSAATLYDSITKHIYTLPPKTRIFVGHDYPPAGQAPRFESTIEKSQLHNIMLNSSCTKTDFVAKRQAKDQTLDAPKLLLPAMQINILGGQLPQLQANQRRYLTIPLKVQE